MSLPSASSDRVEDLVRSLSARWDEWYHIPVLGAAVAFMLWVRLQAYDRFTVNGQVYFSGNDAYYHFREVMYVVHHWPWTMPFDPWSYFPYGTEQGQFGTLFDQMIATAALIVGLGSPSEQLVGQVFLVAPAVFGALVAIPVYGIGKRIEGRSTGVLAVLVLALLPGSFLIRTTVGFGDHNSAEPLFQAIAVLATIVAVQVAEREKPVFEQFVDRDWSGLRTPVVWSVLAGVATFLYIWVWPPALFLVGLLGVFYVVALSYDFVSGRSPEHVALAGIVSMTTVFVLSALWLDVSTFQTSSISITHLLLALGVAAGCAFMAWLARVWEGRSLPTNGYPATVGVLVVVGIAATALLLPDLFKLIRTNVTRIFAFGQSDTTLTVREAQSVFTNAPRDANALEAITQFMVPEYGLAILTAIAGLVWLVFRVVRRERYSTASIFVVVWAVATFMMALTQIRFNYYLATIVAILSAYFLVRVFEAIGVHADSVREVETYQVLTILVVAMIVVVPLLPGVVGPGVVGAAGGTGPGHSVTWGSGLDWLEDNTPQEGRYGGANNDMAYYGSYEPTGDYDYPEGAYGVMSWWDYGHWITVLGERIPNANPFQQGPVPSSVFFQSTNETHANLILEALPSLGERPSAVRSMSTSDLRSTVADQSPQHASEDTRYVVIDNQMAGGKFPAIATWAGPGSNAYFQNQQYQLQGQNVTLPTTTRRYDQTMLSKLYYQDAGGLSHYRLVHEVDAYSIVGGYISGQSVRPLTSINPPGWTWEQAGPVASQLSRTNGQVVSLGQGSGQYVYNAEVESRVKLYERVEGATLTGTVPGAENGTLVFAYVQLQTQTGRNFTYLQRARTTSDGSFEMTVPYATDDAVGTAEGGTNSSVSAHGEYTVQAGQPFSPSATGTVAVPEQAIYEGREIQVDLQAVQQGNESAGGGNTTDGSGNQSAGSGGGSTDSGGQSDNPDNATSGSLTVPRPIAASEP